MPQAGLFFCPLAALLVSHVSQRICSFLAPCQGAKLLRHLTTLISLQTLTLPKAWFTRTPTGGGGCRPELAGNGHTANSRARCKRAHLHSRKEDEKYIPEIFVAKARPGRLRPFGPEARRSARRRRVGWQPPAVILRSAISSIAQRAKNSMAQGRN